MKESTSDLKAEGLSTKNRFPSASLTKEPNEQDDAGIIPEHCLNANGLSDISEKLKKETADLSSVDSALNWVVSCEIPDSAGKDSQDIASALEKLVIVLRGCHTDLVSLTWNMKKRVWSQRRCPIALICIRSE